ncbi:hypothetical protein [Gynurincola endophyticus]|uniref:hypothetical protein n=1 Tax=Gynurincola endophyticus TaxID=2479004 RepID=UPI000F8E7A42|nr:hypothetical protein [Gynurincola endophyticus]
MKDQISKNILLLIIFAASCFTACKKETEKYDNTEIILFEYTDTNGETLQAPVYGDTIYVYWPPMQDIPETITPAITLHQSANIFPASGHTLNLTDNNGYTITAENGSVKKYNVKLIINQPYPFISQLQNINTANGNRFWVNNKNLTFAGDNFLFDGMETKVWAKDESGVKTPVTIVSNTGARLIVSAPPKGKYKLIIELGIREVEYFYDVEVIEPFATPAFNFTTGGSVKRGETITLSGTLLNKMTKVTLGDYFGVNIPLTIVTATESSIMLQVPSDAATGSWNLLKFEYSGDQYYNAGALSSYLSGARVISITQ